MDRLSPTPCQKQCYRVTAATGAGFDVLTGVLTDVNANLFRLGKLLEGGILDIREAAVQISASGFLTKNPLESPYIGARGRSR